MQNNVGNRGKSGRQFTREMSFMRAVVNEYHLSNLSYGELARKHGLGVTQIAKWVLKFSGDLEGRNKPLTAHDTRRTKASRGASKTKRSLA
ncbi:hypothetical protein GCM10023229_15750 [Flavisolibacter ginsenosidimutans]